MAKELDGYGPTAGSYMGGSGANLNEQSSSGFSSGHGPDRGNGGNSGNHDGGSGHGQSSPAAMVFGFPVLATPGVGGLAVTVSGCQQRLLMF